MLSYGSRDVFIGFLARYVQELWLIKDFPSTVVAGAGGFIVNLVCFFMKLHLLVLLQDNCLDLLRCVFLRKLSGCVRNITAFCQHLLRPIKYTILANTDILVKPKHWPIYRSITKRKQLHESENNSHEAEMVSTFNYILKHRQ